MFSNYLILFFVRKKRHKILNYTMFMIDELQLSKRIEILKSVSIFSESSHDVLRKMAEALTDITVNRHETVFVKGQEGNAMYIIVSGGVNVHDGSHIFNTLGEGHFFGEYSLLESSQRTASVTANCTTHLLRLDQETFIEIMMQNPDVMRGVLKSLVVRVKAKDNLEEELMLRNAEISQQKEEIETQRDEIEAQRDEIETQRDIAIKQRDQIIEQKKEMTDSIQYASRIQMALLPPREFIDEILPQNFILYKPRDIVSGDFYWITKIESKIFVVAADCTGHGVPGAFMSMLGMTILNSIVHPNKHRRANEILNLLRSSLKESLRQTGREDEAKDGMDIAFCIIDTELMQLQYSGAYNTLYFFRKETNSEKSIFTEIKADRMPIGI